MAEDGNLARYEKKKLLGKGNFGEAWLVVSTASGRLGDLVIANSATRFSEDSPKSHDSQRTPESLDSLKLSDSSEI